MFMNFASHRLSSFDLNTNYKAHLRNCEEIKSTYQYKFQFPKLKKKTIIKERVTKSRKFINQLSNILDLKYQYDTLSPKIKYRIRNQNIQMNRRLNDIYNKKKIFCSKQLFKKKIISKNTSLHQNTIMDNINLCNRILNAQTQQLSIKFLKKHQSNHQLYKNLRHNKSLCLFYDNSIIKQNQITLIIKEIKFQTFTFASQTQIMISIRYCDYKKTLIRKVKNLLNNPIQLKFQQQLSQNGLIPITLKFHRLNQNQLEFRGKALVKAKKQNKLFQINLFKGGRKIGYLIIKIQV